MPAVIHCYAEFVPRFAKNLNSEIGTFHFHNSLPNAQVSAIYASFGAKVVLQAKWEGELWEKAERRSAEIFRGLQSKDDVAKIREDGVWLGDLIYDTYLRDLLVATVDIRDPRLAGYIRDALLFYYHARAFFDGREVRGVFVDHLVYIWQGVLIRVAMQRDIPVYSVYFNPQPSVQRVDLEAKAEGLEAPARFNYWCYPDVFSRLPDDVQEEARKKGRAHLEKRLSGKIQNNIYGKQSAYVPATEERVLQNTDVPKFLILLHDFCDAVHVYRRLLFDDFYEWIHFLLREASRTPYEWYVKPHPNINDYRRRGIQNSNLKVIEELKAAYPQIHFLEPTVSNSQLIRDGIAGLFTMHGSATHEFPFLGVPAVCGADNPHVAYPFAHTPATVEEYARLIHSAGKLEAVRGAEQIAEFCYMHFFYAAEHLGAKTTLFQPLPSPAQTLEEVLEAGLAASSPEADNALDSYVSDLLGGKIAPCVLSSVPYENIRS